MQYEQANMANIQDVNGDCTTYFQCSINNLIDTYKEQSLLLNLKGEIKSKIEQRYIKELFSPENVKLMQDGTSTPELEKLFENGGNRVYPLYKTIIKNHLILKKQTLLKEHLQDAKMLIFSVNTPILNAPNARDIRNVVFPDGSVSNSVLFDPVNKELIFE